MRKYLFLFLILPALSQAQTDLGLWAGANIEKKISKKLSVSLNAQARLTPTISTLNAFLTETGVEYKITKRLQASLYYRYTGRRRWSSAEQDYYYRPFHRFYGDLSYEQKIGIIKLDYRLRYQHQFRDDIGNTDKQKSYLRNKLEVSYPNKTMFTPFVSADFFYQLGNTFDQIRYKAGTTVKLNKHHSVEVSLFTDQQLSEITTSTQLVIGLTYKLKF